MTQSNPTTRPPSRGAKGGYQAVLFDAGDTLIDFYSTGERVTRIIAQHTGQQIPAAQAGAHFDTAFRHAYNGQDHLLWVNTHEVEVDYWRRYYAGFLQAAGVAATPALIDDLMADTLNIEIYQPFTDAVPTLERLHAAGKRLVLVSNAFPSMQPIMQRLDLERYFDTCLYSCTVGHEKPHAPIFELALEAAGMPPEATCFVDDVPRNIEAGMSLGIRGYLIDRWDRHRHSPLPRIESLAELLPKFGL